MKRLILLLGFLVILSGCGEDIKEKAKTNLPWHSTVTEEGYTQFLGVDIGKSTFKEMMFKLKLLAEPALFEDAKDGTLTLEAYFGKKKFGILEARLIVEMDADEALLKKMLKESVGDRDSTPSNHWKYQLTVENTKVANDLRIWRLIYLPTSDYEMKQMNFFGKPEEVVKVNKTAEYWFYPSKGIVLLYDTAGKEIFYYAAQKDYARLKASLPTEAVMQLK